MPVPDFDTSRKKAYDKAVERTVCSDDVTPRYLAAELERTEVLPEAAYDLREGEPQSATDTLTRLEETSSRSAELLSGSVQHERRFDKLGVVGSGATAKIYAVRDNCLDRIVAVKFLGGGRGEGENRTRFLDEARITATLEHPNIMPVYDIGVTDKNEPYFIMKKVSGISLGDALRSKSAGGGVAAEVRTFDEMIRVFLKVCDALAYAHGRGFVHQDIKPDNIMLGEYGEVLLLDWGSSLDARMRNAGTHRMLFGTPAYMSPEQSRREVPDARSDIYCLGATLFKALTLRHPWSHHDPEQFWAGKREGRIDRLTHFERQRIPSPLVTIALKALRPDPSQRYQRVEELADELKRYQAGRAVHAHRENAVERLGRWYRHNRKVFWPVALTTVLLVASVALLAGEKIRTMIRWREVVSVDFSHYRTPQELAHDWSMHVSHDWQSMQPDTLREGSGWVVRDGMLQGSGEHLLANISYRTEIAGDLRVEWEYVALRENLNLNCFIGGETRFRGYAFHVGGFGDPRLLVVTKGERLEELARVELEEGIETGRIYRFRLEKEGIHLRLFIDGRREVEVRDYDMLRGPGHQTFGFESVENAPVAVTNLTVLYRPLPQTTTPLEVAHQFFLRGDYEGAVHQYRSVYRNYPRSRLAPEALFGTGRTLLEMDSGAAAVQALDEYRRRYPRHELATEALLVLARAWESLGDASRVDSLYELLAVTAPATPAALAVVNRVSGRYLDWLYPRRFSWPMDANERDSLLWVIDTTSVYLQRLCRRLGVSAVRNRYLELALRSREQIAPATIGELQRRYPAQLGGIADVLNQRIEYDRILALPQISMVSRAQALLGLGAYQVVVDAKESLSGEVAIALCSLGRYEEVVERHPEHVGPHAWALLALGRYDELERLHAENGASSQVVVGVVEGAKRSGRLAGLRSQLRGTSALIHYFEQCGLFDSSAALLRPWHTDSSYILAMAVYTGIRIGQGRPQDVLDVFSLKNHSTSFFVLDALQSLGREDEFPDTYGNGRVSAEKQLARGELETLLLQPYASNQQRLWALLLKGSYHRIVEQFPGYYRWVAGAGLVQGEYDDVIQRCRELPARVAAAHLLRGDYERVIEHYPQFRELRCHALCAAGDHERARVEYPDLADIWGESTLQQGEYEAVAAAAPRLDPLLLSRALVGLGRSNEIPRHSGTRRLRLEQWFEVSRLLALERLIAGDSSAAHALLHSPDTFLYRYTYARGRFERFLLGPVLAGLAGGGSALRAALDTVCVPRYRYTFAQTVNYEAGLLAGRVDARAFLSQPVQVLVQERLALLEAILADIDGDKKRALAGYRAVEGLPYHVRIPIVLGEEWEQASHYSLFTNSVVQRFVRWRLDVLDGA